MNTIQQYDDKAELRQLIADWSAAVSARDLDGTMAAYTPDTVLFDAMPPARTVGAEAIRNSWQQALPHFPDVFRSEHHDLTIEVDGDLAFVFGLHRFVPEPPDHCCGASWLRVTICFRRTDSRWQVVHEHVSVPFDPETGQAVFIPTRGE